MNYRKYGIIININIWFGNENREEKSMERKAEEDLVFIAANRFKGSKVKEIVEYWILRCAELEGKIEILELDTKL